MGKNKLSSGLINVVTYDTNSNISLNSGSNLLMSLSGSGKVTIPGNLVVLGGISGSTAESASYSLNADKIDNLDSTQLVLTSSFNSYTSSASSSLGSLSGSVATTTLNLSSSVSSSIGDLSGSIATTTLNLSSSVSSSIGSLSGSVATTTSGLSSSIGSLSSSVATTTSGLSSSVGSLSSSVATTTSGLSSSIGSLSSSVATNTSGLAGRIGTIEGNYATTGSNIFVGSQVITGSLYITTDLIVQGSSSLQNITASAVSIGTNTVMLNTATPAVRFAGISVQDSGSNAGVTGSILWDGLCNKWVYSNPSGIGYSGGMLISGPRTSTLGSEAPLTCNYIAKSGGGDHLYDSCIIDDGTTTCIKNNLVTTGTACFGSSVIATQSTNGEQSLSVINTNSGACAAAVFNLQNDTNSSQIVYTSSTYTGVYGCGANAINIINRNSGPINFLTAGYSSAAIRMVITNCGNVGIGTYAPVSTYGFSRSLVVSNPTNAEISLEATTYSKVLSIGVTDGFNYFQTTSGNGYDFQIGGGSKMRMTSAGITCFGGTVCAPTAIFTGCVGIGQTSPAFGLEVYSTNQTAITSNNTFGAHLNLIFNRDNTGGTRNCFNILADQNSGYIRTLNDFPINFVTNGQNRLLLSNTGISCFACQVCAPKFIATQLSATCLTLNSFSSGNGLKMDYGSASGQITAMNLIANGTTNGFIGIQMVDGSNGDLWLGSSANRSMTIYRTGNHGFNVDAPCTRIHSEGGYGSTWGGNGCFFGGGISGGQMPYGDIYGNGASYTYQTCCTTATNGVLFGGYAAGYFKGGSGTYYGGGGAGIVAIGGNGGNSESVNAGGGAGIFARGGKNGAGSLHSYAGWFDGGNVMIRCGFLGVNNTAPRTFVHIVGASCGEDVACGFGNADSRGTLHVEACSGFSNSNITVENTYGIGQFMQWSTNGMRIGHRILKGGGTGDVHMTAGQDSVKLVIYTTGNIGAPSGSNIYAASDCRLKKNIRTISYGLCDVMKLQPKVFNWKDNFTPSENGKEMLGFVAQDIQTIIPEVVEQFSDGSDITFDCETITNPLRVNEKFIIPILTRAIQEQQCIICSQSSMINTLKSCLGII